MIIHYNCTRKFLVAHFLLICHLYPPSFHEILVVIKAEPHCMSNELGITWHTRTHVGKKICIEEWQGYIYPSMKNCFPTTPGQTTINF